MSIADGNKEKPIEKVTLDKEALLSVPSSPPPSATEVD